jgi:hypothetical protein
MHCLTTNVEDCQRRILYFSVGTNWSFSLRAYVLDHNGGVRLHRGGAGLH